MRLGPKLGQAERLAHRVLAERSVLEDRDFELHRAELEEPVLLAARGSSTSGVTATDAPPR